MIELQRMDRTFFNVKILIMDVAVALCYYLVDVVIGGLY